jgi:hypothetical protein
MTIDPQNHGNSIEELLELNHKISHNLQIISLLAHNTPTISEENLELLNQQAEEAVSHYSYFRRIFYTLIELNKDDITTSMKQSD